MGKPTIRQHLAENLKRLMEAEGSPYRTPQAVEVATAGKGGKIGKSTIQRILASTTPVNLDYIETLGKVWALEPARLLQPNLGRDVVPPPPNLDQAVTTLATYLHHVPEDMREAAAGLMKSLALSPHSYDRLLAAMKPLIAAGVDTEDVDAPPFELESPGPKARPREAAEKRRTGATTKAAIYYGDGNKKQRKLPFVLLSKDELKQATPSDDERKLWRRIEDYPKASA